MYIIDKNDKKIYWKHVRGPECQDQAISNKNADGQPVDASQTEDNNHAPSRADFRLYWSLINVCCTSNIKICIVVLKLMEINFQYF